LPADVPAQNFYDTCIDEHRLIVRNCSNYEDLETGHIRVAVRSSPENSILLKTFQRFI
jgi:threonine-phosphate decarboxylase